MSEMFEIGASVPLRAVHRLPWMTGPEGEPHEHDYRLEVVVGRPALDDRGMVVDLDALEAALGDVVARVEGRDLEEIVPPGADAATVEVLARWAHDALAARVADAGAVELSVRAWESPTAFGGYRGRVTSSP